MSPSESDLRAALRQDEDNGFSFSADAIIAEGQAVRARRVRLLSGAAAAVLVAAGAVGLALARGNDDSGTTHLSEGHGAQGGSVHGMPQSPGNVPAAGANASPSPSGSPLPIPAVGPNAGAPAGCPASSPHLLAPGGGSPGQFGADKPLFAKPVTTLVVCSYDPTTQTAPGRLVYRGQSAAQLVASLENATPKSSAPTPCDPGPTSTARLLDFIGVTAAGTIQPPVTATVTEPACNVQVTNGTAVRFGWMPPALLTDRLNGLTPPRSGITITDQPSGIENGTPIHS